MNRAPSARALAVIALGLSLLLPAAATAGDEEGCLICHNLELRKASPSGGRGLRIHDPAGGRHDSLFCTDCHLDAGTVPHPASPSPARCIGSCHADPPQARETHRLASYGGLTEAHRAVAAPHAPCRLCHGAMDRPGDAGTIVARCAGCHPDQRTAMGAGVHARFKREDAALLCVRCHKAHPAAPGGKEPVCGGKECHPQVTAGMRRIAGHGGGKPPNRLAVTGIFLLAAAAGWMGGRALSPRGDRRGDGR